MAPCRNGNGMGWKWKEAEGEIRRRCGKLKRLFQEVLEEPDRQKRILKFNRILAEKRVTKRILFAIDVMVVISMNCIVNSMTELLADPDALFGSRGSWLLRCLPTARGLLGFWWLYLVVLVLLAVGNVALAYQIRTSLSEEDFNVQQKGSSRWTTVEELEEQYRQIDERGGDYDGLPGMLISSHGGKHFIDDGNTNSLVFGITRAGKDEIFVQPSIYIYARSRQRPSMVVADTKGESYRACKAFLEAQGYQVLLYNLSDNTRTMSVNYMHDMLRLYKNGDYAAAENLAYGYAYSLFAKNASEGENSFFWENAASLLSALILAHIEDCLYENRRHNEMRRGVFEEKKARFRELDGQGRKDAEAAFRLYGGKDAVMAEEVACIPEDAEFCEEDRYERCANIYSVLVAFSELSRDKNPEQTRSALDDYFGMRPPTDRAKLKYLSVDIAGDRAKGDIFSSMAVKVTAFLQESVAKMSVSNDLDMVDLGFGEQPVAVFIMLPDYEKSLHGLASIFIRQSYYMLAKACDEFMKCRRPVRYILNEFGNLPKIENMANMLTVCLGRNITFDLYVQSIEQIESIYGKEDAATITSNCGNQIYLMANDSDTAKYFVRLIGNETYIDIQRTGEKLSFNKTFMERPDRKPLLDENELLELKPGHCVIRRAMKRFDLKGNKVRPRPIYNRDENGTALKYRHEYLSDVILDASSIRLSQIAPPVMPIGDMGEYVLDYRRSMERFRKNGEEKERTLGDLSRGRYEMLKTLAEEGIEYGARGSLEEVFGWSGKLALVRLQERVEQADMKESMRDAMLKELKRIGKGKR